MLHLIFWRDVSAKHRNEKGRSRTGTYGDTAHKLGYFFVWSAMLCLTLSMPACTSAPFHYSLSLSDTLQGLELSIVTRGSGFLCGCVTKGTGRSNIATHRKSDHDTKPLFTDCVHQRPDSLNPLSRVIVLPSTLQARIEGKVQKHDPVVVFDLAFTTFAEDEQACCYVICQEMQQENLK